MNGEDECGISRELIPLLTEIAHSAGLAEQDFRCPLCSKSIGPTFSPYRLLNIVILLSEALNLFCINFI